jgi:hypothetical protein
MSEYKKIRSELLKESEVILKTLLTLFPAEKKESVTIRELFARLNAIKHALETLNFLEDEIEKIKTNFDDYMVLSKN